MRVRFAPSPTGALHIGGARTALYNWLLARGSGGTFVLRIEDTDRERSTSENIDQILDALTWLELDWDEGPISQAERIPRHREEIERLVASGDAYEDEGAVRLRVPDEGSTTVEDAIRGPIVFEHSAIDDFVIARSDGSPLYNLAVAVDDHDMGITHVVRGADHISNTPRQLMILKALGADPPVYAHLPLLHGPDGKKLSKRHGAASVQELRDAGYLPEAIRNYLALLGWGYDDSTTFFTTEELIERFSLDRVSKGAAVFDEQKLRWMNGRYLRELSPAELAGRIERRTGLKGTEPAVAITQEKMQTLADFDTLSGWLYEERPFDEKAWRKTMKDGAAERLEAAREALANVEPWTQDGVEEALNAVVERLDAKPGKVFQPIRVAITGTTVSPGIYESVALLGRDATLTRIDRALAHARENGASAAED
ncbi:MAG: nondiscriminating glutamyl-tRNA synthetase [Thermoleophilaceae bacterium]|nr:nondiscriminating glutamyl-tRNA synthetase [Thermoleophilaceae bacterium]